MYRYFLTLTFLWWSCGHKYDLKNNFPYKLQTPSKQFLLPSALKEVSGIAWMQGDIIAAVEDNFGDIYFFSLESGAVAETQPFDGPGDFEDVVLFGDTAYVLRSDGTIFEVVNGKSRKYDTFLSGENNTEGLALDSAQHRLIIALKGDPYTNSGNIREFYAFDLHRKSLIEKPLFTINPDQFKNWFGEEAERIKFRPSGLSIHPFSKDLYIISSTGKVLIRVDFSGNIKDVARLERNIHAQPEGITFDKEGNLFISNEGTKEQPVIYKFKYTKNDQ